jgi:bifunctional UDP-N-acetylglucosamine pyrophosphorylase/glucosamine-1-phosphate N-acetyltransferase
MINIVILAAGKGKRMFSDTPKVLHLLAGKPLVSHVLDTARSLSPATLSVVYGHGGEQVPTTLAAGDVHFVKQSPQLGTGHAVQQALPVLKDEFPTLILYGDVPLLQRESLQRVIAAAGNDQCGMITVCLDDPSGYGRIVRADNKQSGKILAIVEHKDATEAQRTITEINTGIMVLPTQKLKTWLATLSNDNAQGEYYLTDVVAKAVTDGVTLTATPPSHAWEILGINSKKDLAICERIYQRNSADMFLASGVTIMDPERIDIRGKLHCGRDVTIDVGCVFEGAVTLEDGVHVGAHCIIKDAHIGKHARIHPFCHIDESKVGDNSQIGPYARLRPGTVLSEDVHIGNFVEVKKSQIGAHSKANHLAYIGDATIGQRVNIGAGTITCNYDGANKFQTIIEDDAFIGSDTQLVAPVTVGQGATLGAGTTLAKDAPAGQLTVSRAKQVSIAGWVRPSKKT